MGTVLLRVEKSKSRTGKHAVRDIVLIINNNGDILEPKYRSMQKTGPIYSKGEAYIVSFNVPENHYAVQVHLVRNLRGHVKGYIEVYDHDGRLVYRVVYHKLKIRYSKGDPSYSWIIRRVAEHLNLPVKHYNLEPTKFKKPADDRGLRRLRTRQ